MGDVDASSVTETSAPFLSSAFLAPPHVGYRLRLRSAVAPGVVGDCRKYDSPLGDCRSNPPVRSSRDHPDTVYSRTVLPESTAPKDPFVLGYRSVRVHGFAVVPS